jgi:hypothetical protein
MRTRAPLFQELLLTDLELREKRGGTAPVDLLVNRFPEFAAVIRRVYEEPRERVVRSRPRKN